MNQIKPILPVCFLAHPHRFQILSTVAQNSQLSAKCALRQLVIFFILNFRDDLAPKLRNTKQRTSKGSLSQQSYVWTILHFNESIAIVRVQLL